MTDILTPNERSQRMGRIRSKETTPEKEVRKIVYKLGFRYRLYAKGLPGCPDLVFRSTKRVIFVNGCFWHYHESCKGGKLPKTKLDYWKPKLENNRARDKKNLRILRTTGWKVMTIWECQLRNRKVLARKLTAFFHIE